MLLPQTYVAALLLAILSMICWGSWANTTKLTGKWRFELYYFDYAFGVLLIAVIAAFTIGSVILYGATDFAGFDFLDDVAKAGRRQIFYGFVAGVVFNLANMLLVAAISVAGLAVAFPIGIGLALVIGVISNFMINPQGNPTLLFAGTGLVAAAIIVDALAYRALALKKARAASPPRPGKPAHMPSGLRIIWKGLVLSIASGILMGCFYPLVELGKAGELGLGPYSIGVFFGLGVFVSTFVFNAYFMNLPVQGGAIGISAYFRGTAKQHLLGILGGVIWCVGMLANFAAASAPPSVQVGPAVSYAMGQGATMVSALWGLLVWKEFAGGGAKVNSLVVLMLVLFLSGLGLISIAPLYAFR